MQSAFSWAPKVARKCESKHWYACGADGRAAGGRAGGVRSRNFLGWVDLLTHGAPQARFARQSSAKNPMELKVIFLEIVYLDLYSHKVWGFSIFSFYTPSGDIYGRPLLKKCHIVLEALKHEAPKVIISVFPF